MGLGDPTTCVYQFIFDQDDSCDTAIIQYYIMHGLGLCIKLNSFVNINYYIQNKNICSTYVLCVVFQ